MKIVMVKKRLPNGAPCLKCDQVESRLHDNDDIRFIDHIAYHDLDDPDSEGSRLAALFEVKVAPFFVVTHDDGTQQLYTVYLKLRDEVLRPLRERLPVE